MREERRPGPRGEEADRERNNADSHHDRRLWIARRMGTPVSVLREILLGTRERRPILLGPGREREELLVVGRRLRLVGELLGGGRRAGRRVEAGRLLRK